MNILVYVLHLPILNDGCPPPSIHQHNFVKLQSERQTSIITQRQTPQHNVGVQQLFAVFKVKCKYVKAGF